MHAEGMARVWLVLVERLVVADTGVGGALVGIGFVKHVCMRVVLLFCTHGINLGRTELYKKMGKEGAGQLAELLYMSLKWRGIVVRMSARRACHLGTP